MNTMKRFLISLNHAWQGLILAFKEETSFRIQIAAAILVGCLAFLLPLQRWERSLLALVTGAVIVLELINSVIERFVDIVKPRLNDYARHIKDLSAAAVLIMALTAGIIAIVIFWPYLHMLVNL